MDMFLYLGLLTIFIVRMVKITNSLLYMGLGISCAYINIFSLADKKKKCFVEIRTQRAKAVHVSCCHAKAELSMLSLSPLHTQRKTLRVGFAILWDKV